MQPRLYDSELKLMNLLWAEDGLTAQQLAKRLHEQVGWSKTTTYTVIKKCIEKALIERIEPGFHCRVLISREQAQESETDDLIDKLYGGSPDMLVASLLDRGSLSGDQIKNLRNLVERFK